VSGAKGRATLLPRAGFAYPAPAMAETPRFPVVYLLGVAHCGSTLLGRLLDMHSRVLCTGELMRTDLALEADLPCGCGARLSECAFWKDRLPLIRDETRLDPRRFTPQVYERIARSAGREVAFDLSKTRVWRAARRWKDRGEGYVFLVRDSRGVLASAARVGKDLGRPLAKHKKWMRRLQRFVDKRPERSLVVHYEDLCRAPEAELRRLCAFLGLDFEPAMLRPADRVHHFVHSSASGYLEASNEIRLDERWRAELTPSQLAAIEAEMSRIDAFRDRFEPAGARA
jgi:hypothetical protein